jgi:hypothetical protein
MRVAALAFCYEALDSFRHVFDRRRFAVVHQKRAGSGIAGGCYDSRVICQSGAECGSKTGIAAQIRVAEANPSRY